MKIIVISLILLISGTLKASFTDSKPLKRKRLLWVFSFSNNYDKKMFVVNSLGPDIFNARMTYGFELGLGISYYFMRHLGFEYNFTYWYSEFGRSLMIDADKINDLQRTGSYVYQNVNYDLNNLSGVAFNFNLIYRKASFEKNSPVIIAGLSLYSPAQTAGIFSYHSYFFYNPNTKQPERILNTLYYTNPRLEYYPMLNLGVGYEYKLRRRTKLSMLINLRYGNKMFFFGEYSTTASANFNAKGRLYYKPSALNFKISYMF